MPLPGVYKTQLNQVGRSIQGLGAALLCKLLPNRYKKTLYNVVSFYTVSALMGTMIFKLLTNNPGP